MSCYLRRVTLLIACALVAIGAVGRPAPPALSRFARLVEEYLESFAARHPSIAAGNGLHQYDGRLEDFSATAISAEVVDLGQWKQRLRAIDPAGLTLNERVDHRILSGIVDAWMLDLGEVQTWRLNPMIYASAVSDGVRGLMLNDSVPAQTRMRQAISKLDGVPLLIATARANLTDPPPLLAARGAAMFHATAAMIGSDLPRVFKSVPGARLQEALRLTAAQAADTMDGYATYLEKQVLPRATGSYAVGKASLEARFRAEELIDLPAAQLLAIGERELAKAQAEFAEAAGRMAPGRDPLEAWADVLKDHPRPGELVKAAQRATDELLAFVTARRILTLPPHAPVVVAAAPDFDLGLASMRASPPLEPRPGRSVYSLADARPDWPAEQQEAWLQKFNVATLADITAHEVYPGHFAQSLLMRRTPGKIRRIWIGLNPFPQPSSGQDGWAHYAEQLVQDEGFHRAEPKYKLAQVSEALTRICRLIAGIRLHTGDWTVEQAAAYFQAQAHLPAPAARQEAERGTYDPTYGGYFLGKLALLQLRRDVQAREGSRFDLRAFHTRLLANGIAPWWAHRQLLLPGDTRAVIE